VCHDSGPLLIIAGAGTGKTTVITRRIANLLASKRADPDAILALTFTDKAAAEMEERVDLLVPYGYLDISLRTFHAFGDRLVREHAVKLGLSPQFRVLTQAELLVFLRRHVFELPLDAYRPLSDPTRSLEALMTLIARAKDEAVSPEEFLAYARELESQAVETPEEGVVQRADARRLMELAKVYAAYQALLRKHDFADFGDQVALAIQLLEQHPDVLAALRARYRYILVDEFQDTNYAQFRLLQLLAPPSANVTVVADDDQSIYKWRGAAISNVLKFLDHYAGVRTVVLTENFRSTQAILDSAYRLIRFNDPDRLEVRQGIDKRLVSRTGTGGEPPRLQVFDNASAEADWVVQTIRQAIESGARRPEDFAILVRTNRDADIFLRAMNVARIPWQFSGASGLFSREESKMLLSCLRALADPDDSLSWYHVASSPLYRCPMEDLAKVLAQARLTHESFREALKRMRQDGTPAVELSEAGRQQLDQLLVDVARLLELSRDHSAGQVLYDWLKERGLLAELSRSERDEEGLKLQTIARFFHQLRRAEELIGPQLPEIAQHLELFEAIGNEPVPDDDPWADRVNVLTLHKAKGLEFPVVFLVRLVQGRFPTPQRRDPIELPDALLKDILPMGDYHLQEERRLFYVGMTRAKVQLYMTAAYDYGGKTARKISQFVLEALELASPSPQAKRASAKELIERSSIPAPLVITRAAKGATVLRLDPHGVDDYLTCPLKYRYSHVLKIPVLRHHLVVYGSALHKAVEAFFTRRLQGGTMNEAELLEVFERHWTSEGFLTREHEALRVAQGQEVLRRFHAAQLAAPETPLLIEEKFRFRLDDLLVVGRWDRVDRIGGKAVIIDYKSSDVREQAAADRRARESLQLQIYALAWYTLHGELPDHVELRFLETGVTGTSRFDGDDFERATAALRKVAQGVQARQFNAQPSEFACHWCAFQAICPSAFQAR